MGSIPDALRLCEPRARERAARSGRPAAQPLPNRRHRRPGRAQVACSRKISKAPPGRSGWGEPVLQSEITTVERRPAVLPRAAMRSAWPRPNAGGSGAAAARQGHGAALERTDRRSRPKPPTCAPGPTSPSPNARRSTSRRGARPLALAVEAATLLDVLTDAVAGQVGGGAIHNRLALAWGQGQVGPGADLIRRMLVLVADHEAEPPSAFAARVAASTRARRWRRRRWPGCRPCPARGTAGRREPCAASRPRQAKRGPREAIANRLADDRACPASATLYPDGDPRAAALLDPLHPAAGADAATRGRSERSPADTANVDFALMAGCEALKAPRDALFALFSVARCAGWIAHAIEQGQTDRLIRPRARYVGPGTRGARALGSPHPVRQFAVRCIFLASSGDPMRAIICLSRGGSNGRATPPCRPTLPPPRRG